MVLGGGFAALFVVAAFVFLPSPEIQGEAASTTDPVQAAVEETIEAVEPAEEPSVEEVAVEEPVEEESSEATEEAAAIEEEAAPEPAPEVVTEAPAAPEPQGPEFDTFRVETDGSMVIAGRAEPGQVVDVMLSGQSIDRVTADSSGAFVSLPVAGPSDQPRRLTLIADPDGAAIESLTSYIVAPIAAPVVVAEEAPVEEEVETAELEAVEEAPVEEQTAEAPAAPALEETVTAEIADAPVLETAPSAPPTVLQADQDGVRIVQGEQSEETDNVALDTITYDPEGDVQLAGRASTDDGEVQVYINNEPLAVAPITEGDWRLDLPDIDTGVYTLRVDEVDEEGEVVSRIETPFKREEPEEVAAVLAEETEQEGFEVAVRTVQPGSTLWAIAEETMGEGILYVEVFEANRDLIRNPDLIYPGQIFRIPEMSE